MASPSHTTHFGYQEVNTDQKEGMVRSVFNNVASNYDLMNDAMSLGVHRLWKKHFVAKVAPQSHERILDVAGGTGDIAFAMSKAAPGAHITICDINEQMLREGHNRAIDHSVDRSHLEWVTGDAQTLPVPSNHYHAYTIAFGIRNVTDVQAALNDAYRSLNYGGRFYCLEFTPEVSASLQPIYDRYSFNVIPVLGGMLAKDKDSYQYLVESIRRFPNRHDFEAMVKHAGFEQTSHHTLSGGIVAIHSGWKL